MRRRGRQESRILYFFRTPPHVKVGRAALDEEAIRLLEQHHPEISFDWNRMLRARPAAPMRLRTAPALAGPSAPPAEVAHPAPPASEPEPAMEAPEAVAEPGPGAEEPGAPDVAQAEARAEPAGAAAEPHPVVALVGVEGLERLRARYAELLARINERIADPGEREALRQQAAALDPDRWVTPDEARAGLEHLEARYHELRMRLGIRRRRRRRRSRQV